MSSTEYRVARRRARTLDGVDEGAGSARNEPQVQSEPAPPEQLAAGSQRLPRVEVPPLDPWSMFEEETADIDLPELAPVTAWSRNKTETIPPGELALALEASREELDNAATLPALPAWARPQVTVTTAAPGALPPAAASAAVEVRMPVIAVSFGDQRILIVRRGDEVELIFPGGTRLAGPSSNALALAEALTKLAAPR